MTSFEGPGTRDALSVDLPRPSQWLTRFGKAVPGIWRRIDEVRATLRGSTLCFCPLSAIAALINPHPPYTHEQVALYKRLGALAAWRVTQGIYAFDRDMLDSVWETEMTGPIPTEVLLQLPEWCPYICFDPPRRIFDVPAYGFWTHLDIDGHQREWRVLVDMADQLVMASVPLHPGGTIAEGLKEHAEEAARAAQANGSTLPPNAGELMLSAHADFEGMLSLTLYLCSENADILAQGGRDEKPGIPGPRRVKGGDRFFPPHQPRYWDVASRVGADFRAAVAKNPPGDLPQDPEVRRRPRPHIRKAHWHTYKRGPRTGFQTVALKWMPPIPINATPDTIVPTVHPVPLES